MFSADVPLTFCMRLIPEETTARIYNKDGSYFERDFMNYTECSIEVFHSCIFAIEVSAATSPEFIMYVHFTITSWLSV